MPILLLYVKIDSSGIWLNTSLPYIYLVLHALAEIRDAINNGDGELLVSNKEIKLRVL